MSGAYSIFPLRLVVVFNLTTTSNRNDFEAYSMISLRLRQVINLDTCLICNALAVSPLTAGIGAVDRIRPLGGEGFSASFADPILAFFQSPLFQIFLIPSIPAQTIIAIFLGFNQCVEIPPAALADDFPYSGIWSYPGEFFFIPLLQRFLIFIFPVTVPHRFSLLSIEQGGLKISDPPHPVFIRFLFPAPQPAAADTAFCYALSFGKPHSSILHRSWWW